MDYKFFRSIKNGIGNLLGYPFCCVTGDTFWRTETIYVDVSNSNSIIISKRALREYTKKEIADAVIKKGLATFSLDEIMMRISNNGI